MATRTISNAGGNYNSVGTWVEGAVPTNADDVVATATSGNLTINVASAAKTLDLTNYVGTITFTNTLTVSGNVTLVPGATYAGSSILVVNATATLTANGAVLSGGFRIAGTTTVLTLADDWACNGILNLAGTNGKFNGHTFTAAGGFTATTALQATGGTTKFILTGGTWSGTGGPYNDVDIAGNVTLSGSVAFGSTSGVVRTLKYVSGTVATTGSTLVLLGTEVILDTAGIAFNNITFSGLGCTVTLNSLLTVDGVFRSLSTTLGVGNTFLLTFAGTAGANVHTWRFCGRSSTINLKDGLTYNVTDTLEMEGISGTSTLKTTSGGNVAYFNVTATNVTVAKFNITDIDSSGGNEIMSLNGTLNNSTNWINTPAIGGGEVNMIYSG